MRNARSDFAPRQKPSAIEASPSSPIDVTIEKLIYGGEGLAHHDGSTIFVPFVLPSERVTAEPVERKKKFIRATVRQVLEPSPQRVSPPCPHFGLCGGCNYQHIPCDAQFKYKEEILRETLRHLGKIDWSAEIKVHASEPWHCRNRAQWKIRPVGSRESQLERGAGGNAPVKAGGAENALAIGYFRANSTSLCPVNDCPILAPSLLRTLLALRDALASGRLPRELREIEAFTNEPIKAAEAPRILLTLTFAGFPSRAAEHAQTIREIIPEADSVLFHDPSHDRMELFGPGFIEYRLGKRSYRVGHFSFFQVNRFLAQDLAGEVAENEPGGELALDLFAGVGLFAPPLAERFHKVIAVESNPAAARDLQANCKSAAPIETRTADVGDFLERFRKTPDLVVLDPPRAGLSPESLRRLVEIAAPRITYVSCEPPTLARDLRGLLEGGYEIAEIHLFDLFPQTFHMETVARLRRRL
jgi:23S rRNA (uracil1939-C5)-methyltransferase